MLSSWSCRRPRCPRSIALLVARRAPIACTALPILDPPLLHSRRFPATIHAAAPFETPLDGAFSNRDHPKLLTITTTYRPATDPGYLLMKNPANVHTVDLAVGCGVLFFPEAR